MSAFEGKAHMPSKRVNDESEEVDGLMMSGLVELSINNQSIVSLSGDLVPHQF
jgi:hypothetical protein